MIKIICVGKIKEKFYRDAILEYQKRLSKYTKLEIIEVRDVSFKNKDIILDMEKESIVKHIGVQDYVISLEIDGILLDSPSFSKKIETLFLNHSTITFIIGGSYGLHPAIHKRADFSLSFSPLTFPHPLFRVLLLEQIYRAYKIQKNETYHK